MNEDESQDNRCWKWGGSQGKVTHHSQRALEDFKSEASVSQDFILPLAGALPLVANECMGQGDPENKWSHSQNEGREILHSMKAHYKIIQTSAVTKCSKSPQIKFRWWQGYMPRDSSYRRRCFAGRWLYGSVTSGRLFLSFPGIA